MAPCSPYAQFRADAWMRESSIQPREQLARPDAEPKKQRAQGPKRSTTIQGQLFLFPIIVAS
ncbi:hypothetical protein [Synechococcus sp. MIT S1220]|uniref:hypothetical protein n=1 Tax=Synechococcus sp. MIT S1220 TaxID=3082549 RepID=UPI0039AFBA2B